MTDAGTQRYGVSSQRNLRRSPGGDVENNDEGEVCAGSGLRKYVSLGSVRGKKKLLGHEISRSEVDHGSKRTGDVQESSRCGTPNGVRCCRTGNAHGHGLQAWRGQGQKRHAIRQRLKELRGETYATEGAHAVGAAGRQKFRLPSSPNETYSAIPDKSGIARRPRQRNILRRIHLRVDQDATVAPAPRAGRTGDDVGLQAVGREGGGR